MRRDMDLVREILRTVQDSPAPVEATAFTGPGRSLSEVVWHFEIMADAGLLDAFAERSDDFRCARGIAYALTWEGCEFADTVADAGTWAKVKGAAAREGVPLAFYVAKALGVKAVERKLGL